jgi:hypothetical protein
LAAPTSAERSNNSQRRPPWPPICGTPTTCACSAALQRICPMPSRTSTRSQTVTLRLWCAIPATRRWIAECALCCSPRIAQNPRRHQRAPTVPGTQQQPLFDAVGRPSASCDGRTGSGSEHEQGQLRRFSACSGVNRLHELQAAARPTGGNVGAAREDHAPSRRATSLRPLGRAAPSPSVVERASLLSSDRAFACCGRGGVVCFVALVKPALT